MYVDKWSDSDKTFEKQYREREAKYKAKRKEERQKKKEKRLKKKEKEKADKIQLTIPIESKLDAICDVLLMIYDVK